jgi:hypothetical protein
LFNTYSLGRLLFFLSASCALVRNLLPVGLEDEREVETEVERDRDHWSHPQSGHAPLQDEDTEPREWDTDDPVTDHGAYGGLALLTETTDDSLSNSLNAIDDNIAQDQRVN